MFENSTYSSKYSTFNNKNTGGIRFRASFGPVSFKKGQNMEVFKGKAFSGQDYISRSIVVRGIRHYCGNEDDFQMYKLCNEQSRKTASQFNQLTTSRNSSKVRFVVPTVTQIDKRSGVPFSKKFEKDETVAFEEQLKGKFTTFIDKRGHYFEKSTESLILEAFSHYSFVLSKGNFVICGLKGVHRRQNSEFVLTNPTIHSREGKFGPKDKRDPGINDVMENHTCNKFCRSFLDEMSKFDNGSDEY